MLPAPLPVVPLVKVIHDAALTAVQLQPLAAVTPSVPLTPMAAAATLAGETAKEQPLAACVMTKDALPAVSVAVRWVVVVFGATLKFIVALPLTVPVGTVTHPAELVALQMHPVAAVTATLPVPPAAGNDTLVADVVFEHGSETVKEFEGKLLAVPLGPTTATRAS